MEIFWNHTIPTQQNKGIHNNWLCNRQYSRTSIIRTSIIRISWLSGLFLWSQFGHEYLLVMIKIRSQILFKTTALKSAVKSEVFLFSNSKISAPTCCNSWKTFKWVLIGSELHNLLLSEISHSTTFYWLAQRGMQNKQASVTNVCSRSSCLQSTRDPFFQ